MKSGYIYDLINHLATTYKFKSPSRLVYKPSASDTKGVGLTNQQHPSLVPRPRPRFYLYLTAVFLHGYEIKSGRRSGDEAHEGVLLVLVITTIDGIIIGDVLIQAEIHGPIGVPISRFNLLIICFRGGYCDLIKCPS